MKKEEVKSTVSKNKHLQHIEDVRQEFLSKYKVHDVLKKVVFAVCFIGIVVCFIVGNKLEGNTKVTIQIGGAIVFLAIMLVYGIIVKKAMDKKMREYFKTYYDSVNKFVLDDKNIQKVMLESPGKIQKEDFLKNDIYKNIFEVGSRGLTSFEYNKISMTIVDCAAQVKGDKRVKPVFVGKYLEAPAKYNSKEAIVIYLRGTGLILPPTNVDNKKVVLDNKKMVIYTNSKVWKKVITPKVIKLLSAIKTNDLLVDLTVCLLNKKVYVCMGYNDPLMILPLEKPFDPKPNEEFKKELAQIFPIVEALN